MTIKDNSDIIRIYVGTDRSQMIGVKVLDYSVGKHTSQEYKVFPLLLDLPEPKNKTNLQRTGFSFSRFAIPQLAGYQGKAIYMDADMQVFKDIKELWDIPFGGHKILIQEDIPPEHAKVESGFKARTRTKQTSVFLLDCGSLDWKVEEIIAGLDGKYSYKELMSDLCILDEDEIGYLIPFRWNSLEHWDEATCNIHYTDMNTQPWVSPDNKWGHLWVYELKEMLEKGVINWGDVETEVDLGYARPSLLTELKLDDDLSIHDKDRREMLRQIDKKAGFIMHKGVYEAKRLRQEAETEYLKKVQSEKIATLISRGLNKITSLFPSASKASRRGSDQAAPQQRHFSKRKPLKVLIFSNAVIPTLQISFLNPLRRLVQAGAVEVQLVTEQDLKKFGGFNLGSKLENVWDNFKPSLVVFCRYSGPLYKEAIDLCLRDDIPSIKYLDDDLLNVPKELGEQKYKYHSAPKRIKAVEYLLRHSTLIYSSTSELSRRLKSYGFDKDIYTAKIFCPFRSFPVTCSSRSKTIGYMGYGHEYDLKEALPGIVELLEKREEVTFELFGTIPKPVELERFGERIVVREPVRDYDQFMDLLFELNWAIGICPLADLEFNSVKANTKWVEYASAGIAVVASDHPVYRDSVGESCGILVKSRDCWCSALEKLLDNESLREQLTSNALKEAHERYNSALLEQQLLDLFTRVDIHLAV